jgi:uncharacterized membrane protein
MRRFPAFPLLAFLVLPAACGSSGSGSGNAAAPTGEPTAGAPAADPSAAPAPAAKPAPAAAASWALESSGEGTSLVLSAAKGTPAIRLFCPAGEGRMLVNVPAFKAVGSEERLSFGSGGNVAALVADTRGDRSRGGVSGWGAVPSDLPALLSGPPSATYGAQTSGPHPALPEEQRRRFVAACREGAAAAKPAAPAGPGAGAPPRSAGPCRVQGDRRLDMPPVRAVGTEPFWGARIEGRCVTYSHPENQAGTRVWTQYSAARGGGGRWRGNLAGRPFDLTLRPQPGCSDGMSDRRYPLAADLVVGGERRRGCAAPE